MDGADSTARAAQQQATGSMDDGVVALASSGSDVGSSSLTVGTAEPTYEEGRLVWTADLDCTVCHSAEEASFSDAGCLASTHADVATCASCHDDETKLAKAHKKVKESEDDAATKLRRTKVSDDACLACHGPCDALAGLTVDSTALTDSEGTVVNPHELPDATEHEPITCVKCHTLHTEEDVATTAYRTCVGRHHAEVFECNTCHS